MKLPTYALVFLILISCSKKNSENIIQIIDNDDLASFQKLRHEINLDTVNFDGGGTALHYALKTGSYKISEQLIKDNYKLNAVDSYNLTPLLITSLGTGNKLTNILLEKPIELNTIDNTNGYSAVHYASHYNNLDLIKKLARTNR